MWIPEENDWLLIPCAVAALTSLPLALRMVPPNGIYGFNTRFTRSSAPVWCAANAFFGRVMVAASIANFVYLRHLRETAQRR